VTSRNPRKTRRAAARPALEILHNYASTFRDLVNAKVWSNDKAIAQLIRLNGPEDWDFLRAAMDIVGDAWTALDNVQRFGISGPTKYNEVGERYLRLYGLLSAVYIQQEAALTIYDIMRAGPLNLMKKKVDALEIRQFRHKITAHGTGYRKTRQSPKEAYVPIRFEIGDIHVSAINNTTSTWERIDLKQAIEEHLKLMITVLDATLKKTIDTFYRNDESRHNDWTLRLKELRIEKNGGYVVGGHGGPKIIMTFAGQRRRARAKTNTP
jgi:hypothetical protein